MDSRDFKLLTPENRTLIAQHASDMLGIAAILTELAITCKNFDGSTDLIADNLPRMFKTLSYNEAVASDSE